MPSDADPPEGVPPRRVAAWVLTPLVGLLVVSLILAQFVELRFIDLTRDVFSTARIPVYTALVSNVGAFLWASGVAICLFARGMAPAGERRFLLASAAIGAVLLADDFYMVHEWIGPNFLGVPEEVFFLTYASMGAAYVIVYRERITRGGGAGPLIATAVAFVVSMGFDLVERPPAPAWQTFGEEGMKLLGIGCWVSYLVILATASVRSANAAGRTSSSRTGGR